MRVSRTIASRVLRYRAALLCNDVPEADFGAVSLVETRTTSLLAVPIVLLERTLGVIYVDTRDPSVRFDEEHLRLLVAIAGIAAGAVDTARHVAWLESEARRLEASAGAGRSMIGESAPMQAAYRIIARAAPSDATVLIVGESGTGKELAARAIHRNSARAAGPFVAINCAAMPEQLLESELFGYERGAFTGAAAQKRGKLETANGGTVFLDEVGELTPQLQAKLLRALQEREAERLGGTRPVKLDIRLVAATNRNLKEEVKRGAFRQDFYFRLDVVSLRMPPLRERPEDIPALARSFVAKFGRACNRRVVGISQAAMRGTRWLGGSDARGPS